MLIRRFGAVDATCNQWYNPVNRRRFHDKASAWEPGKRTPESFENWKNPTNRWSCEPFVLPLPALNLSYPFKFLPSLGGRTFAASFKSEKSNAPAPSE